MMQPDVLPFSDGLSGYEAGRLQLADPPRIFYRPIASSLRDFSGLVLFGRGGIPFA